MESQKALVVDIDGTLCDIKRPSQNYSEVEPEMRMVERLRQLKSEGWRIILSSSRGMRTHQGNHGEIACKVMPTLIDWLMRHEVPCDELHLGKPWPGTLGYYVDDRAIRPREFLENDFAQLDGLVRRDRIAAGEEAEGTP